MNFNHGFADIEDVKAERSLDVRDLAELHRDLLQRPLKVFDTGDFELLLALNELGENSNYSGEEMVKADEFTEWARDYTESLCDIPDFVSTHVNWEALANGMLIDYQEVEFLGQTYRRR